MWKSKDGMMNMPDLLHLTMLKVLCKDQGYRHLRLHLIDLVLQGQSYYHHPQGHLRQVKITGLQSAKGMNPLPSDQER
jgi:hypothetical protein